MVESDVTKSGQTTAESGDVESSEADISVDRTAAEYARRVVELSAENNKRKQRERNLSTQLEEAKKLLSQVEEEKTKQQGEYKSAYEKTKQELETERKAKKEIMAQYAYKAVTAQISSAAMKAGCVDPDALIKLAGSSDMMTEIEPDDGFNVPDDQVKSLIEKAQSKWTYLFGKPAPSVKDGTPMAKPQKPALSDLSLQQQIHALAEMTASGKTNKKGMSPN